MATLYVTPSKSNVGLQGQSAVVVASVLPGGTAILIPAATLAPGDGVAYSFRLARRGAQRTIAINHNLLIAGSSAWGGTLQIGAPQDYVIVWGFINVISNVSQSHTAMAQQSNGIANGTTPMLLTTVNLTTTALTIDFQAAFASAATDTYGLDGFTVQIQKAA